MHSAVTDRARPEGDTPTTRPRKAAVVYNPVKVDLDALREIVQREEELAGWSPTDWFATSEDDPGSDAAQRALDFDVDMVIAAGGDGTVRAVAEVLAGSNVSLGLLPAGTGNLLARNLNLTLDDVEHSVRTAFTGRDRAIDTGIIEVRREDQKTRHLFLVMAGVGIDAMMLAGTDEGLKAKIGWLAYVGALAKSLRDSNRISMKFGIDGGRARQVHAHTVIVGNCGTLTANVLLLPDAVIDDGIFDILFLRPSGLLGWVQTLRKVLWENGVLRRVRGGEHLTTGEVDSLYYLRGRELVVTLSSPQEIELDGDPIGITSGFRARVDRGGLRVRVPQDGD